MPKISGMELRNQIHENEDIRLKTIPFLFFTTSAAQQDVSDACSKSIQFFFVKPADYTDLKDTRTIVEYCKSAFRRIMSSKRTFFGLGIYSGTVL
jgi:CheY-like chemotaxis protein